MEKTKFSEKGITLIALIITIIVMLILVAVTITVALNGGIFIKAKTASEKTQIEAEREELLSAIVSALDPVTGLLDRNKLATELTGWTVTEGEAPWTCKTPKGNEYTVAADGTIGGADYDGDVVEPPEEPEITPTDTKYFTFFDYGHGSTCYISGRDGNYWYSNDSGYYSYIYYEGETIKDIVIDPDVGPNGWYIAGIQDNAFQVAAEITSFTVLEGSGMFKSIGAYAFNACTNLREVRLPSSINSIGSCAFADCTSLTTINYGGTAEQWNSITLGELAIINGVNVVCSDGTTITIQNI